MSRGLVFTPDHIETLRGWLAQGALTRAEMAERLGVSVHTISKRATELGYGFNTASRRFGGTTTYRLKRGPAKTIAEPVPSVASDLAERFGIKLIGALMGVKHGPGEYAALTRLANKHGKTLRELQGLLHRVRQS